MRYGISLVFLFLVTHCFAQSKQVLMDTIVKINSLDDEPNIFSAGFNEEEFYRSDATNSNNYYNFKKLKKKLSKKELLGLTSNPNAVLRLYAIRDLIENHNKDLDIKTVFLNEINRKDTLQNVSGCIISYDATYEIVYHDYWNATRAIAFKNIKNATEKEQEAISRTALQQDKGMMEINKAIIGTEADLYWLLYDRLFDGLVYDQQLNPAILQLLYQFNNSYAYDYLLTHFPKEYAHLEQEYYLKYFPKANFKTNNSIFYLFEFTKRAFESKNQAYIDVVIQKLKEDTTWRTESSWFKAQIFDKYNVKL